MQRTFRSHEPCGRRIVAVALLLAAGWLPGLTGHAEAGGGYVYRPASYWVVPPGLGYSPIFGYPPIYVYEQTIPLRPSRYYQPGLNEPLLPAYQPPVYQPSAVYPRRPIYTQPRTVVPGSLAPPPTYYRPTYSPVPARDPILESDPSLPAEQVLPSDEILFPDQVQPTDEIVQEQSVIVPLDDASRLWYRPYRLSRFGVVRQWWE